MSWKADLNPGSWCLLMLLGLGDASSRVVLEGSERISVELKV